MMRRCLYFGVLETGTPGSFRRVAHQEGLPDQGTLGSPRFPLKGSFKGDVDIGIDIDVDME